MDALQDPRRREATVARADRRCAPTTCSSTPTLGKDVARRHRRASERSGVRADHPVPAAPFCGARALRDIPLDEVFELLDLDELYRLQWGGARLRRGSSTASCATSSSRRWRDSRHAHGARSWLAPQAVYGYFPAQSRGNAVIVYDPDDFTRRRHGPRDRPLHLPATGRPRAPLPRRLLPLGGLRRHGRRRVADRDRRRRSLARVRPATARRRVHRGVLSSTASPWKRRRRWPNGCTGASATNWAFPADAASATRGATAPAPTSTITRSVFKLLPAERDSA